MGYEAVSFIEDILAVRKSLRRILSEGFSEVVPILAVGTIQDAWGAIGDFLRERHGHGRHGRHSVKPTAKKGNPSHSMARGTEPDFSAFSLTFFDSVEG